jgi:hypothetical protein
LPPLPTVTKNDKEPITLLVPYNNPPAPPPPEEPSPTIAPAPPPPPATTKYSTVGVIALDVILNDLGIMLSPSDALTVNEYVVSVVISGSVPEITPVEEFSVTPEGSVDPLANAYVIVLESESVADKADKVILTCSLNVPKEPLAVCHTGDAFT